MSDHQILGGNQSVFIDLGFHIISTTNLLPVAFKILMFDRISVNLNIVLEEHPEGFEDSSIQRLIVLFLENIG